jgi:hypothetical protein
MERQITMTWTRAGAEFSATDASLDKPEHSGPDPEKTGVDLISDQLGLMFSAHTTTFPG